MTLFGRYGHQVQGNVRFDRALTLGAEINGSYWDRGGDSVGLAAGLLKSSRSSACINVVASLSLVMDDIPI